VALPDSDHMEVRSRTTGSRRGDRGRPGWRLFVALILAGSAVASVDVAASAETGKLHSPICDQPVQHLTASPKVFRIIDAIDRACAWTGSIAGLPGAEERARAAKLHWVAYDLEPWAASGPDRNHPLGSITRFAHDAHHDGFRVLMTPWTDWPHAKFEAVVRRAAWAGDMLDVQIEGFSCYPKTFGSLARTASMIARGSHPQPILVNQTSGTPCDKYLASGWRRARPFVAGRWVWSQT